MKLHYIPIALVIIAFATINIINFGTELGANYNQTADMSTLNNLSVKFDEMENKSGNLKAEIEHFTPEEGGTDVLFLPYKFIRIGFTMLDIMWTSMLTFLGVPKTITTALGEENVPGIDKVNELLSIIIIFIVAAIFIYGFWKWKFGD